jgi:hypothetical protein
MPDATRSAHRENDETILGRAGLGPSPSGSRDDCPVCRTYVAELRHAVRRPPRRRVIREAAADGLGHPGPIS